MQSCQVHLLVFGDGLLTTQEDDPLDQAKDHEHRISPCSEQNQRGLLPVRAPYALAQTDFVTKQAATAPGLRWHMKSHQRCTPREGKGLMRASCVEKRRTIRRGRTRIPPGQT